jgi:hypothetical protein
MAGQLAVQRVKELAISLEDKDLEEKKDLLKKCAMTTLNSKLVRPLRSSVVGRVLAPRRNFKFLNFTKTPLLSSG